MAFTEDFLKEVEFAGDNLNFQQANLVALIEKNASILLAARQATAEKILSGNVSEGDEKYYMDSYYNLNKKLSQLLGVYDKRSEQ